VENPLFYRDALNYKRKSSVERLSAANEIKKLYLDPESRLLINVLGKTRQEILSLVETNQSPENLFDGAMSEVLQQMYQDTFSKFKGSKGFSIAWEKAGKDEIMNARKNITRKRADTISRSPLPQIVLENVQMEAQELETLPLRVSHSRNSSDYSNPNSESGLFNSQQNLNSSAAQ